MGTKSNFVQFAKVYCEWRVSYPTLFLCAHRGGLWQCHRNRHLRIAPGTLLLRFPASSEPKPLANSLAVEVAAVDPARGHREAAGAVAD